MKNGPTLGALKMISPKMEGPIRLSEWRAAIRACREDRNRRTREKKMILDESLTACIEIIRSDRRASASKRFVKAKPER